MRRLVVVVAVCLALAACAPVDDAPGVESRPTTTSTLPTCEETRDQANAYLAMYMATSMSFYMVLWLREQGKPCRP